jgi:hypothetical protein
LQTSLLQHPQPLAQQEGLLLLLLLPLDKAAQKSSAQSDLSRTFERMRVRAAVARERQE